ncbi:hypothetical protein NB640_10360 [Oxalobacter vibrioformis]|uniref:Uncharacterized protein n=1 Tax=Oxalobacter vibrioformis TaxID=933080 RepID=A0A9E9LY87_9BURK|nr:hypothetical protein [Oxalobacter vibrioformis]WAW09624.1 hypothetical protein NB640_10360 [Oxalobacter vibrioformis]
MRTRTLFLSLLLVICAGILPASHAKAFDAWTTQFETTFTASCEVGNVRFAYPAQFILSETTKGVCLETKAISGQISTGSSRWKTKEAATELLITRQGGKKINEFTVNSHTVYASTSLQGNQRCRTYLIVLKNSDSDTLYLQFRWQAQNPIDYTPMLDRLVASMQGESPLASSGLKWHNQHFTARKTNYVTPSHRRI